MATISFNMTSTPLTGTISFTGTDTDMQNLLNWGAYALNNYIQATFNPTGNPAFVPTNAQIGSAIAHDTISKWKANVQQYLTTVTVPAPMTWA